MSESEILSRVFNILDVGRPDMSTFSSRLKYQRIVYLLQSLTELSLGYGYIWYVKGPYSPELAQALYKLKLHLEETQQLM